MSEKHDKKKEELVKLLTELLEKADMDWAILTCAKKGGSIFSSILSDEENIQFVLKLHDKFWEGCPCYPSQNVTIH